MSHTTVEVRSLADGSLAVGSAGSRTITIDRSKEAGGFGLGFNGGELLLLAIGGCYSNDIFREADKRGIKVRNVRIKVTAEWGGEPVGAQNVSLSAQVEADASEPEILDLMRHTDRVAEIPNSLRRGAEVKLVESVAIGRK